MPEEIKRSLDIQCLTRVAASLSDKVDLVCLHGSAKDGFVKEGSDVDIAILTKFKLNLDQFQETYKKLESAVSPFKLDLGFLNEAEPIYKFEALKGKNLYCSNLDLYAEFCSLTSRQYEDQIVSYERQYRYRKEFNS